MRSSAVFTDAPGSGETANLQRNDLEWRMSARDKEFDKLWDNKKGLRDNLISFFDVEFVPYEKSNINRFFSQKHHVEKKEFEDFRREILAELKFNTTRSLEDWYMNLCFIRKAIFASACPDEQLCRLVDYAILRIEEFSPHLRSDQSIQHQIENSVGVYKRM